jgi:hypothetical protein
METVNYYRENNTDVYVLLLDTCQALDKVNYVKLFQLLLDKQVNSMVIRCLLYMYTNQYLNIKWNCCMSKYFSTTNGVKQRGVLSPILFGVYIDELLCRLRKSGYGCKIGHLYFGGVGYINIPTFNHKLITFCLNLYHNTCSINRPITHLISTSFFPRTIFIYHSTEKAERLTSLYYPLWLIGPSLIITFHIACPVCDSIKAYQMGSHHY